MGYPWSITPGPFLGYTCSVVPSPFLGGTIIRHVASEGVPLEKIPIRPRTWQGTPLGRTGCAEAVRLLRSRRRTLFFVIWVRIRDWDNDWTCNVTAGIFWSLYQRKKQSSQSPSPYYSTMNLNKWNCCSGTSTDQTTGTVFIPMRVLQRYNQMCPCQPVLRFYAHNFKQLFICSKPPIGTNCHYLSPDHRHCLLPEEYPILTHS